jgi:hypothetical protein
VVIQQDDGGALCIGQASHAWLSGQLARAWGNERFGPVEPREEVCLAAEQHDVGMAEWDVRPELNPETGLPRSFMEMDLDTHLRLWRSAPGRLVMQSRYAALLVSMHGTALYGMRDLDRMEPGDAEKVRAFMRDTRSEQGRLAAGLDLDRVRRNQRLIWTWDFMSLALCLGWAPTTAEGVPAAGDLVDVELTPAGERRVSFDPWPFSALGPVRVRCEGRRLTERFDDEGAMRAALHDAPVEVVEWELVQA